MMLSTKNNQKVSTKTTDVILQVLGSFFLVYTVLRAYLLSFTWDESWTYLEFVRKAIIVPSDFNTMSANNHLLNTWLMRLSCHVFGLNEFALRLPNLLFHVLFIVFSAKIVRHLSSSVIIICSFLILNCNPFVLDFFSLARGYGISFGLMMVSLYYAYRFIEINRDYRAAFLAVFFAALATLANIGLLNYFIILAGILVIINGIAYKQSETKNILVLIKQTLVILSPLSVLYLIVPIIISEKKAGALFFGGNKGFWIDSVLTLIKETFYENSIFNLFVIPVGIGGVMVLLVSMVIVILELLKTKKQVLFNNLTFVFVVLVLCFFANMIQHYLLGILFPLDRTALFYYPLFVMVLLFLMDHLSLRFNRHVKGILILITLFMGINFIANANLSYAIKWKNEADVKAMIFFLKEYREADVGEQNNIRIGTTIFHESDINFYRNRFDLFWLNIADRNATYDITNDYYFISQEDLVKLPKIKYKVIMEFPRTKMALVSNEESWKKEIIYKRMIDFDKPMEGEPFNTLSDLVSVHGIHSSYTDSMNHYSDGFTYKIEDSLMKNKTAAVSFKAMVYLENMEADANMVISFERNGKPYSYSNMNIKDVVRRAKEWTPINLIIEAPKDINKDDLLKCYLWNLGKHPVFIDVMELKITAYNKK